MECSGTDSEHIRPECCESAVGRACHYKDHEAEEASRWVALLKDE